ncbi:hypothetical protein SSBR45G_16690 [Bradyrhizobium sp. SSBR45G]|uniref:glycosyltransferase family 4 protein n=1 Tax=unclassified Bradyrhizobium TaxID=2631580 RepID=UPI002342AC69|nr:MULTISPECIES: glycosyltransferase family 4 protein [unclassified Bradyrhizobium]GLH76761.1 hypothetical protein SSBR45G_16690 [Bradyrhizobium sp. SSBR45G]GLH83519.1 hypothetical protein SSBR45R_09790 [Bradyrhizobium sp. SSBR45R]
MSRRVVVFNNMITPYTNRLYNELVAQGLDLAVLSCTEQEADRSWAGSFEPHYPHRTVAGISLPLSRSRYTHVNVGVGRALSALAPAALVVNGFYPSMLAGAVWAQLRGRPLALTIDGWRETMPDTAYHRLVRPWLLRRCRTIVCCGEKGRDYFLSQSVPADRIATVPLVPAWGAPPEVVPLSSRPYSLLWCARINDDAKNAAFFERVVIGLSGSVPGLKVRVVGSGPVERRMLSRLGAAGIEIRHDPYIPWHRMAEVYSEVRVLLLPSLLEPWGLVCNEAMQCGVPCIVSPHVGAAGDLVRDGENGFVRALAEQPWIDAARLLLETPALWDQMSVRARETMQQRSLGHSAAAFMQVAEGLLGPAAHEGGR